MSKSENLRAAKRNKNDEFYTQLNDVAEEVWNYKEQFKDKVVFLNCDDPESSNFWFFFSNFFEELELKKLIATHYETDKPSYKLVIDRKIDVNGDDVVDTKDVIKTPLEQNGDFRSEECVELLKECDIVVTNPPFSLFREFVDLLVKYDKKFLILGNSNAYTYKNIFPLFMQNKIRIGYTIKSFEFAVPDSYQAKEGVYKIEDGVKYVKFGNIRWFTNLEVSRLKENISLFRRVWETPELYPKFDNYDAINVDKVKYIPEDYTGIMGVPITFLEQHNPEQFEILGSQRWCKSDELIKAYCGTKKSALDDYASLINGKEIYTRIFIKHKHPKPRPVYDWEKGI